MLAQKPLLILLDESTNHLDPLARQQLLALIKNKGITAIAVLHDLSLIDTFAERVLILSQGEQIVCDHPSRALTSRYLQPVFGLNSFTVKHPASGKRLRILRCPTVHDALSKIGFAAFLAVTPAMWASASDFPVTVDSCGQPVTFTSPPARAVINDLNMAEMAFALHLQNRIVGLTGISGWYKMTPAFKQAMGSIPELAPKYPSLETLLAASPDFFLLAGITG